MTGLRFAYADPPYLGCGARLYGEPEWDDIATHRRLIERLTDEYPDGWVLSCTSGNVFDLAPLCPSGCRLGAWVKPFAAFKPNVNPAFAWEPVIWRGGRTKRSRKDDTIRDWHSENITMLRGVPGAKPPGFAMWVTQLLGADVRKGDTITDLFHGSGAMLGVWRPATERIAV